jgi:hypothetical protein
MMRLPMEILAADVSPEGWETNLKSLIFFCVFLALAIGVAIWWLRR